MRKQPKRKEGTFQEITHLISQFYSILPTEYKDNFRMVPSSDIPPDSLAYVNLKKNDEPYAIILVRVPEVHDVNPWDGWLEGEAGI